MGYKTFVSLNVAVIGENSKAITMAKKLATAGHAVALGCKNKELDKLLTSKSHVEQASIEDAAAWADVIIICADPAEVREIAYLLDDVRRKVIVDATFANSENADDNVNTTNAIKAITGSPMVVKTFNCTAYREMISPLFKGQRIDMFVAGNSIKAKALVKILANDLGCKNCLDFGDDSTLPLLEEMAKCWHNMSQKEDVAQKLAPVVVRK